MTKFMTLCAENDMWDLWDDLCNDCPMYYSEDDLIQAFAMRYDVDPREVLEYFF